MLQNHICFSLRNHILNNQALNRHEWRTCCKSGTMGTSEATRLQEPTGGTLRDRITCMVLVQRRERQFHVGPWWRLLKLVMMCFISIRSLKLRGSHLANLGEGKLKTFKACVPTLSMVWEETAQVLVDSGVLYPGRESPTSCGQQGSRPGVVCSAQWYGVSLPSLFSPLVLSATSLDVYKTLGL